MVLAALGLSACTSALSGQEAPPVVGHDPALDSGDSADSGDTADTGDPPDTDGDPDTSGGGETDTASDSGEASASTFPHLLLTDADDASIYVLDALGAVLDLLPSPTPVPSGVAADHRRGDGFWLAGTGDQTLYKLDWDGNVLSTQVYFYSTEADVRGLHHYWDGPYGEEVLAYIFTNELGIQVAETYDVAAGQRISSYSYATADDPNTRLDGFWGIVVDRYTRDTYYRWSTREDGTYNLYNHTREEDGIAGLGDPKGVTRGGGRTFVVSDRDDRVYVFDEGFRPLYDFATPGSSPRGLSAIE